MERLKFLRKNIVVFIIAVIAIIVISVIIKYQVEGESNIPFQVSKIMVISNAYGIQEESDNKWQLDIVQNNDIYIDIVKNKNYADEEIINKVILDNFEIDEEPQKGEVVIYSSQSVQNGVYYNDEEYEITDKIEYTGNEEETDIQNLQISNQGGLILLRVVNQDLGQYISNDDEEIRHDGTLLEKIDITNEDLKLTVSFDISIELKSDKNFKTRVTLELPKGNLIQEGTTNYQINGTDELVFKRY
jgi:hypothetical protein